MIAQANDAGGDGDCFFLSLYQAAAYRGKLAEVKALFNCMDHADGRPASERSFVSCVRKTLGTWLRRNCDGELVASVLDAATGMGDGAEDAVRKAMGRGGAVSPRDFAFALADSIQTAHTWMSPVFLEVVYKFLPRYNPAFADSPVHDVDLCLYITSAPNLPGFKIPATKPLVLVNLEDVHYQYVTMVPSRTIIVDAPAGPVEDTFFRCVYAAAVATQRLRLLGWHHRAQGDAASCHHRAMKRLRGSGAKEAEHMAAFTGCMRSGLSKMILDDALYRSGNPQSPTGACVLAAQALLSRRRMSVPESHDKLLDDMLAVAERKVHKANNASNAMSVVSDTAIAITFALVMSERFTQAGAWAPAISAELMSHMFGGSVRLVLDTIEEPASAHDLRLHDRDGIVICTTGGRRPIYSYALEVAATSGMTSRDRTHHGSMGAARGRSGSGDLGDSNGSIGSRGSRGSIRSIRKDSQVSRASEDSMYSIDFRGPSDLVVADRKTHYRVAAKLIRSLATRPRRPRMSLTLT